MELGGNAPFLVFEDADLDAAVDGALLAKMRNIGEACTSANRFHVAAPVAEEFAKRLAEKMGALKIGRGTEDDVKVGPLIDQDAIDKVAELVGDATAKGAKVVVGGNAVDGRGYFYEPTVLADVPADARVLEEEIFGPVAPITTFESEEEAIRAANNTQFGLVAYVFTSDFKRAIRVIEGLETGHGRAEPGHGVERRRAIRRLEVVRHRARGRLRGHRGVPRNEVRGRQHGLSQTQSGRFPRLEGSVQIADNPG